MLIVTWIVVGLVTGFLVSKLVIRSGQGLLRDLGLGIAGAVIGGWVFAALGTSEATGRDVFGLIVTLAGACAVLVVYHTLFRRVRQG
jgi:uncharacterized membrane protein YeaQ/YmgE (transglycosylase-associated protein family)